MRGAVFLSDGSDPSCIDSVRRREKTNRRRKMIDNIRVVAWLFFCLLFELLVIAVVSPLHGADREPVSKAQFLSAPGNYALSTNPAALIINS